MSDPALPSAPAERRVLSGMRPTGKLHLGNYVGALQNWVRLQHAYECFFFIADWHALTTDYADPLRIPQFVEEMALDWLSAGLDPDKCTLFLQSEVTQHAELHLALSMITPLSWLERVPTYKDQQEQLKEKDLATYGFLGYPLLQSADILLYGRPGYSLHVPVGADQIAHVELTREVARRFNFMYARHDSQLLGPLQFQSGAVGRPIIGAAPDMQERIESPLRQENAILTEPQVLLTPTPKLPGTDGRKMSKSYNNFILLSDPEPEIRRKLKPMVTDPARVRRSDPGDPDKCPVGDLHKVFSTPETLAKVYDGCRTAGIGCIECKGWAADAIIAELAPMQERRARFTPPIIAEILTAGSERASKAAGETMGTVRTAMGLNRRTAP